MGEAHVNAAEARPPCWRKTLATRVDHKVARLFESYKLMDEAAGANAGHRGQQGVSDYSRHSASAGQGRQGSNS